MKTIRILILEDDLDTLSKLLNGLRDLEIYLEEHEGMDIAVTVYSEYKSVEENLNNKSSLPFDIILLDRDTKEAGSFHVLDLSKIDPSKIIGISSVPPYNEELKKFGVTRLVDKNYAQLEEFTTKVLEEIKGVLKISE